jgi:SAM-dependent methyltransferase
VPHGLAASSRVSTEDRSTRATAKLQVPQRFNRSAVADEQWERQSARWLIDHMCEHLGLRDLRDTEMLDMGCGVKFTRLFIDDDVPIKHYVGIDVYGDMIQYLAQSVGDPRFEYFHIDVRNELYNPTGRPFTEERRLPLGSRRFDLICLFSVFTHLAPADYRTMLKVLRRHVRPDGRLFFTLYVNELTAGGHGLIDGWATSLTDKEDEIRTQLAERSAQGLPLVEPFVDLDPSKPLNWAVYTEEYARELIDGTGWEPLELSPPDVYIQHHFVCVPS